MLFFFSVERYANIMHCYLKVFEGIHTYNNDLFEFTPFLKCILLVFTVMPGVVIELEQLAVNASEGNAAVVCASARFNNEFPFDAVFSNNLSFVDGTAGRLNK